MNKYSAKRIVNLIAAIGVVALGFSGVAQAQFPDKPIQFISPFAAGELTTT